MSQVLYFFFFRIVTKLEGEQYHSKRYPAWASLTRDYLVIMSPSVSSERAFSQGGITTSNRKAFTVRIT